VALTVESNLNHGLCDRDGGAREGAGLDLPVEFLRCSARKPVEFEVFGLGELGREGGVRIGNLLFVLLVEGLTEDEENPVAVGNEDVVEELAELRMGGGGGTLIYGAEEVGVGPPFMADELGEEGKHVEDCSRRTWSSPTWLQKSVQDGAPRICCASKGYGRHRHVDALCAET
jgi:hypothetical protein